MKHYSLFTGIGGIDLAAEWAGFTTVGQCEWADYPYKILCKHWPDVPKVRDVRDVRIKEGEITLLSGGFPCQPFSYAGKRGGKEDNRYLWPEMFRVVREARPQWVLGENVTGIVNVALDDAISDLESEGYTVRTFNIPACAVEAWHERQRIFIVANAGHDAGSSEPILQQEVPQEFETSCTGQLYSDDVQDTMRERRGGWSTEVSAGGQCSLQAEGSGSLVSNSDFTRSQGYGEQYSEWNSTSEWITWKGSEPLKGIWQSEPPVGRVVVRIPSRVDRLKCLGNAVSPFQVYPILKAIAEIEHGKIC